MSSWGSLKVKPRFHTLPSHTIPKHSQLLRLLATPLAPVLTVRGSTGHWTRGLSGFFHSPLHCRCRVHFRCTQGCIFYTTECTVHIMSKKCAIAQRHSPSGLSSKLSICLSSTCPVMLHPSFRTCNLLPSPCSQNCVTLGLSLRSPFLPKCPAPKHPTFRSQCNFTKLLAR